MAEYETPDVSACVREALEALTSKSQRDHGQFTSGNVDAVTTWERSAQFWAAVEPAKRELVSRLRPALAVEDGTPETFLGLLDA